MPREPSSPGSTAAPRDGPVPPGSSLYRLLEMIAREIAKDRLEDRSPANVDAAPKET